MMCRTNPRRITRAFVRERCTTKRGAAFKVLYITAHHLGHPWPDYGGSCAIFPDRCTTKRSHMRETFRAMENHLCHPSPDRGEGSAIFDGSLRCESILECSVIPGAPAPFAGGTGDPLRSIQNGSGLPRDEAGAAPGMTSHKID